MIGKKFGRLTVIMLDRTTKKDNYYECECKCGNIIVVPEKKLKNFTTLSCGRCR